MTSYYKIPTEEEPANFWLKNLNMRVRNGDLCFVIGEVGSGKSSLLLTILGEMEVTEGQIRRSKRIAYV